MDQVIDQLIADFHERPLRTLTRRDTALPWVANKIDSVIGMRRTGKTSLLHQVMADRIAGGWAKEQLLYLNFEDERLLPFQTEDLQRIPDVYYRRDPTLRERPCAFFFDEIQRVPGWERFVRRLLDTLDAHLCITGSSARLLSREIATELRGRVLATEIWPFSFGESLTHAGVDLPGARRPGARHRSELERRFRDWVVAGGFPEVQGLDEGLRVRVLQEYVDVVILRDVVERHRVPSVAALRQLVRHVLNNPGSLLSVHRIYNDLRSQGHAIAKGTVHEYLSHLEDAFFCHLIPIDTDSERVRAVNPRKVYLADAGLSTACARRREPAWGHLLENMVSVGFRRMGLEARYVRTAAGLEVDFVVEHPLRGDLPQVLVQVCADPTAPETREREVPALVAALRERAGRDAIAPRAVIVTLSEEGSIDAATGRIPIVPGWRWFLSEPWDLVAPVMNDAG